MERWLMLFWFGVLLLFPYISSSKETQPSSEIDDLVGYFHQQEDDEGTDEIIDFPQKLHATSTKSEPLKKLTNISRANTLDTLFPFLQQGNNGTSFDRFADDDDSNMQNKNSEDDEYLNDFSNDETFLSPLEKLPIIGNLITGKSLTDVLPQESHQQVTNIIDGFDVKVRNQSSGDVRSLPKDAQLDLEDPAAAGTVQRSELTNQEAANGNSIKFKNANNHDLKYSTKNNITAKHESIIDKSTSPPTPKIHIVKTDSFKDSVHLLHYKPTVSYHADSTKHHVEIVASRKTNLSNVSQPLTNVHSSRPHGTQLNNISSRNKQVQTSSAQQPKPQPMTNVHMATVKANHSKISTEQEPIKEKQNESIYLSHPASTKYQNQNLLIQPAQKVIKSHTRKTTKETPGYQNFNKSFYQTNHTKTKVIPSKAYEKPNQTNSKPYRQQSLENSTNKNKAPDMKNKANQTHPNNQN
eukprot:TCONS_00067532-protein